MKIVNSNIISSIHFPVLLMLFLLSFPSCGKSKGDDSYSIGNILSASITIIKEKGFSALSSDEIGKEIARSKSSPEDAMQKKSTLRQRSSDGSNDYRIIFEDMIKEEKAEKAREYKDPFK